MKYEKPNQGEYHETDDGDIIPLDVADENGYSDERYADARRKIELQEQWHAEGVTEADEALPDSNEATEGLGDRDDTWQDIGNRQPLPPELRSELAKRGIGDPRLVARAADAQFYVDRGVGSANPDLRTVDEKQRAHAAYIQARAEVSDIINANKAKRQS